MSGFSIDWLDLREPADRHARNQDLLADALTVVIVRHRYSPWLWDLGAGTGSTLRAVSQYLPAHRDNRNQQPRAGAGRHRTRRAYKLLLPGAWLITTRCCWLKPPADTVGSGSWKPAGLTSDNLEHCRYRTPGW